MDTEQLLRRMLTQSEEQALILLSPDGTVVGWMMGATRIFGRTADDMVGKTLHCLFMSTDQAAQVPETELATARTSSRMKIGDKCSSSARWRTSCALRYRP
jgi:hypothetical protein